MYTLEDVSKKIIEMINSPEAVIGRDVSIELLSSINPLLGVAGSAVNSFLNEFDNYKVNQLLVGLASGLNGEKKINELYNYIVSSHERAFTIGNIFRQAINAQTPKVCVLYGHIISNHIGEKEKSFTQEELIVCNALISATDFDIKNFKTLMDSCVRKDENGIRKISYSKDDKDVLEIQNTLNATCYWCVYNRIFSSNPMQFFSIDGEKFNIDTSFCVESPADVLLKYITAVQQILNYDE